MSDIYQADEGLRLDDQQASQSSLQASEQRYRTLADSMPQIVWATDGDGSHFYFNRRWYEYTGLSEAESIGFGFANALHPDDLERTLQRWRRAWHDGEGYEIEYRFRRFDGVYHWFVARAMPVFGPQGGRAVEWVGTCTDIDGRKRAEDQLEQQVYERTAELNRANLELQEQGVERSRADEVLQKEQEFLSALLHNLQDGIVACDAEGVLTLFNRATREFHGLPETPLPADQWAQYYDLYLPDGKTPMQKQEIPLFRALQGEVVRDVEMVIAPKNGNPRTLLASGQAIVAPQGKKLGAVVVMHDVTDRKRADEERVQLIREQVARAEAEVAQQRLTFLAEASTVLAESLDYEVTLASVARLAVPRTADWCAVDIVEEDGSLRRLAVAHVNPDRVALAHELAKRFPADPNASQGVPNVLRTSRSELISDIPDQLLVASITDQELLGIIRALGLKSSMVVPLVARGRTLGAISFVSAESGRRFTNNDLSLAEDLARRAAIAVDNALLYRELSQFKTTLDQTLDCVFLFDAVSLRFFYVNQGAIDQVGYSREELLCMTPLDIKPAYNEASFRTLIAPLLNGTQPFLTFETVHRHKDSHDLPVEVSLQYVAPTAEDGRFIAIVRDISEHKRAQQQREELLAQIGEQRQRLNTMITSVPGVVWESWGMPDASTQRIDFVSDYVEQMLGYTVEEWLTTPNFWLTIVHPDDRERAAQEATAIFVSGSRGNSQFRWVAKDGHSVWVLAQSVVICDQSGEPIGMRGVNTDITDRKRAEEALRERAEELVQLTAMLEDRNRELDQFAYITSHDLKAPLRGIANLSQWIEEDLGDLSTPEIHKQMELLRGRVHRMEALIDGILQYSRVGRVKESAEQVNTGALLEEVVDLIAPPKSFTVEILPPMPNLLAERLPLQQVFANLIGNSIKHHNRPDGTVRVSARDLGQYCEFTVADDGPGIAPAYHERVFVIFQTLAPRDKVEGSGLGLSLVKKIVETQGGSIRLESAEGSGSRFIFTWPRQPRAIKRH